MAKGTTTRASGPIETKPVVGLTTAVLIGYALSITFAIWPNLRTYVTPEVSQQLPIVIGGIIGAIAAYKAPHTHRPDLVPVQPAPGQRSGNTAFIPRSGTGSTNVITHDSGAAPTALSATGGGGGTSSPGPTPGGPGPGRAWPETSE
jgi:hypothetical protein